MSIDLLVVSGEPLWPPVHGGRLRTAGLVRALGARMTVRVAAPLDGEPPVDVSFDSLPRERPVGGMSAVVNPAPRIGRALLGPVRTARLAQIVADRRPGTILFAHSYLAAVAPAFDLPVAVDFQDIEVRRMASFARSREAGPRARAAWGLEWLKALRWEPGVARRAVVCAATSSADIDLLATWGARAVLVPNGADVPEPPPLSPAEGPVTFVAGFGYQPNRDDARFLVERVWPRLQSVAPALRLRLVGGHAETALAPWNRAPGVELVSDPESIEPFYREASLLLAPGRSGGGAQVKVAEALARGRLVVATPYSAAAAPAEAAIGVETADGPEQLAAAVLRLWCDTGTRWARERELVARRPIPNWGEAAAPLVDALLRHATQTGRRAR